MLEFHRQLATKAEPFVAYLQQAEMIAWIIYTALFGYGQLFVTLELETASEPPGDAFVLTLAKLISKMAK